MYEETQQINDEIKTEPTTNKTTITYKKIFNNRDAKVKTEPTITTITNKYSDFKTTTYNLNDKRKQKYSDEKLYTYKQQQQILTHAQ